MSHKKVVNTLLIIVATVMICFGCQFFVNKTNFNANDVQVNASIDAPIDFDNENIYSITKLKNDVSKESIYRDNNIFYVASYDDLVNLADLVNNRFNYITNTTYNFLNKTIYLRNDIDTSGHYWEPIGWYSNNTNHDFKGTFDGLGYSIDNMNIQYGQSTIPSEYVGFFGAVGDKGIVKNLELVNPIMNFDLNTPDKSFVFFGFIAGSCNQGSIFDPYEGTQILNCRVTGAEFNYNWFDYNTTEYFAFGGIVGACVGTDIFNCSFNGTVNIRDKNNTTFVGGIAGISLKSTTPYISGVGTTYDLPVRQCYSVISANIQVYTNEAYFSTITTEDFSDGTCWSILNENAVLELVNADGDYVADISINDYPTTYYMDNLPSYFPSGAYTLKEEIINVIYENYNAFYDMTTCEQTGTDPIWIDTNFLLELDANGGTFNSGDTTIYYQTSYSGYDGFPVLEIFLPNDYSAGYCSVNDINFDEDRVPSREGYNFLGWNTTRTTTTNYTGNLFDLDSYSTLFAIWESNIGELEINLNGGSYSGDLIINQAEGSEYTLPSRSSVPAITRTGYTLTGWVLAGGGSLSGNIYTFATTKGTVTAQWSLISYSITYNLNNTDLSWNESAVNNIDNVHILIEGGQPQQIYNISKYSIPLALYYSNMDSCVNYPIGSEWTFVGWYNNSSLTGNKITQIDAQSTGDVSLYAKFENKINLTFDYNPYNLSLGSLTKNDGSGANSIDEEISEYEVSPGVLYYSDLNLISEFVDLPIPTCTNGYYFKGWKLYNGEIIKTYSGELNTQFLPAPSITLLAVWEETPYKIIVDYTGGSSPVIDNSLGSIAYEDNKIIYYGSYGLQITIHDSTPTDVNYRFDGWSLEGVLGTLEQSTDNYYYTFDSGYPTDNASLPQIKAVFTNINQLIVTFDYDGATGGDTILNKTVILGSNYGSLPVPSKTGDVLYVFDGWYLKNTEGEYTTKIFESTTVTINTDHTLYAKFVEATTVTIYARRETGSFIEQLEVVYLNADAETVSVKSSNYISVVVPIGTYITLKATPLEGCSFDRWENNAGDTISSSSITSFNANVGDTYWAYATAPEYVYVTLLDYYASGSPRIIRVLYGERYMDSIDDPNLNPVARPNKTFLGWYYYPDFSGDLITIRSYVTRTYNYDLYPKWLSKEVTATFVSNGGNITASASWTGSGSTVSKVVITGETYGIIPTINEVTKTGYTFASWHTDAELISDPITSSSIVQSEIAFSLYAKYIPAEYTIVYNGNATNPSYSGSTASSIHQYGVAKTLTLNGFSRIDYNFVSWNTASDGSGVSYTDAQNVINVVQNIGDTIVNGYTTILYAQWERKEFTLTINIEPEVGEVSVEQYDIYSDTTTTATITTDGYEYTVYSGNNVTLQAFDQVDVLTGEGDIATKTQYLGYLFDNWNDNLFDKTNTINSIRADRTEDVNYKKITYTINFGIKFNGSVSTESGTLNLSPNDIVSFEIEDTIIATYVAKLGYQLSTGWEWDIMSAFNEVDNPLSMLINSELLSNIYDVIGNTNCANETQSFGNIYVNTSKLEIPFEVIVTDEYRGEEVFDEIQNVISLSFKVNGSDVENVVIGDNLQVQANTPNENYLFKKWSLLTTADKAYYTVKTNSAFTFGIDAKLLKSCYISPNEEYPNGKIVFEITIARESVVTFETGDYGWSGVVSNGYVVFPYSGYYGQTVLLSSYVNAGYTLTGYKYKYKNIDDAEWSELVDITENELDEYTLLLQNDNIHIYPQYAQNTYTATLSIVQKSSGSDTITLIENWTNTSILTASTSTGNDYPNYNGTYTINYNLIDTANYNAMGLFKDDYEGVAIATGNSVSKLNYITANTNFYIVVVPKTNTVTVAMSLTEADAVGGRWYEQDNPANIYLTKNAELTQNQILTLEIGDSFTIHYSANEGYNVFGYRQNQNDIVVLTENTDTITISDFDSTKQGVYTFIFSKIEYTLSVNNNATKGSYATSVSNIYLYQSFDLTGTYNEGYKFVGFECNSVQYVDTTNVTFVPEMIGESTTIELTPLYINQYTIDLSVNNPQYGQVETYINNVASNFDGYYDEGTVVKIELTTDLNHLLDSYTGLEASEISLVTNTEKTYTIQFTLSANRDITLNLDGILLDVVIANDMTKGSCSFNYSSLAGENQYTVSVRYEDLLNITVTANTGWRFDSLTQDSDVITSPIEVLQNTTLNVNYIKTYTVTTSVNNSSMGIVTSGGTYDENTSLTITATPKVGYEFVKWVVNGVDAIQPNEYVFDLTQDMEIIANFAYIEYTFDFTSIQDYFTVSSLSESYHYNDIVSVTLTEKDVLFILKHILTNGVSVVYTKLDDTYSFNILVNDTNFIDKVCVVSADLTNLYTITITSNISSLDLVTIDDAYAYSKNNNEYIYCEGDAMYLSARSDGFYTFNYYDNSALIDNINNPNYILLATQDMTIEVVFDAQSYQIFVVAKELVDSNMVDLIEVFDCDYNTSTDVYTTQTFEMTQVPLGFKFLYFYYEEILPLASNISSLYIDEAHDYSIFAVFERIAYTISCTDGSHYEFTTSVSQGKIDDEITLVVETERGYEVTGWTLNGNLIDSSLLTNNNLVDWNSITFNFVPFDNNESTIYSFAPVVSLKNYTINTVSNNDEQGSATFVYNESSYTTTDVTYGDDITLVATLLDEDLYRFIYWMHNGQVLTTSSTYTITSIDDSKAGTYTAVFGLLTGTISIQVTPERAYFNPTITVDGVATTTLKNNDEVTVSITTSRITAGYVFVGWHHNSLGAVPVSRETSYTFTITKENQLLDSILICEFAPKDYAINVNWSEGGSVVYSGGNVQGYLPATNNFNMSTGLFVDMNADTGYELGMVTITNGTNVVQLTNFVGITEYGWQVDFNTIIAMAEENITYIDIDFDIMNFNISSDILISNGDDYEAVDLPTDTNVTYGNNIDIDATLVLGFNFDGWYIGDVLVSEEIDFVLTSQMIFDNYAESGLEHNVILTAHVSYIEYDMVDNIYATPIGYGDLFANNTFKYKLNDTISLNAIPRTGFKFVGYYINNELVSTDRLYSTNFVVSMTEDDIQARFEAIQIIIVIRGKTENEYFTTENFGEVLSLKNGALTNAFYYNDTVRLLASSNYGYTFDHFKVLDTDYTTNNYVYNSQTYQSCVFTISTDHLLALENETLYVDAVYDVASFTINFSCNMDVLNPKPATTTLTYKDTQYTGSVQALFGSTVKLNISITNNLFVMLGFYNGDSRIDIEGNEYEFVVNQNLTIVAKIAPIISFANFTDEENKTYTRTYNFTTQGLTIGTEVLCHESFEDYVVITYGNSTVAPSNAGTYSVTARIDLPEFSEYESESVTLIIQKLTLTVSLIEDQIITKEYDGFSSVSKLLVQDKLVLNGLIEGHENDTALSFNNVTCEMYINSIPRSEASELCDLVIKDLMLTNTTNFRLDIEDNTILFEDKGSISRKRIYLGGVTVSDIVYNEDDQSVKYGTYNPSISGVVLGDAVSLDMNSITFEYEEYEIGRNKVITGSATLIGMDKDNYELIVANKSSHIYPYELTLETELEGTFIIRDVNRNVFLPIGGNIEVTSYLIDTPIYVELYQIIEPYLGRRNTFEIAYSIVVKDGANVFNVNKPVQFEFYSPFKLDNDVNAFLIDDDTVTALNTSTDDTQILVMTTKLDSVAILKSKVLFPVWLIILVTSIFVGLVTGSVVVIVILRKRKEVIFYQKNRLR